MPKIKIKDLDPKMKISREEMKRVRGGYSIRNYSTSLVKPIPANSIRFYNGTIRFGWKGDATE